MFISPGHIQGELTASASKSHLQRLILASALAQGTSEILNYTPCSDTRSMEQVIAKLGTSMTLIKNSLASNVLQISGLQGNKLLSSKIEFDVGESGLVLRMLAPVIAAMHDSRLSQSIIKLHGTLQQRSQNMLLELFSQTNVEFKRIYHDTISISGKLMPGVFHLNGDESSQHISGLLFALPLLNGDSRIVVKNPTSIPYIKLTINVLKNYGINVEVNKEYSEFSVKGPQVYLAQKTLAEGDFSGASFFLVAGAISSPNGIIIRNLQDNSLQGDKKISDILTEFGAEVKYIQNAVSIQTASMNAFEYNAENTPDLFPPLVCLAINGKGKSKIWGTKRLMYKESSRAEVLLQEFSKLGANITLADNCLTIEGTKLLGGKLNSHADHRIAMAGGIAALTSKNGVIISEPLCVEKSYPKFFTDLLKILNVNTFKR